MKHFLFVFLFFIAFSSLAIGQEENPTTQFLIKRGYVFPDTSLHVHNKLWPDTLYYNTPYKSKLLGTFTIPISFTSIELTKTTSTNTSNGNGSNGGSNSSVEVSPNVSIGIGYAWFWGDFIFNEDDKITVDPKIFFGPMASIGIDNSFLFNKLASFSPGAFIGVSSFTFFLGYDLVNHTPSIDVGSRIDLYSVSQKLLHIIGRVHEVRHHRRIAPPITPY